ncbi:hypothetical protein J2X69_002916 [Algoriphagus sp. 4150]|uniref:hypothetical protein n=1 Tax=Algoriphagus sp. 4150 TaxID=2817756 RepID=UPI002857D5F7|nr:hypothetical protein [Algoriphagus sp. 4150]MDR7130560.1 hypothetical protein [Algoriphagus sp. 4150]
MNKILAGSAIFALFIILLGANRGFDLSDEGMYALLAVPDQENIAGVFNYDLFFKLFYQVTGIEFGLVGLRILRLFTCFIAAASLTVFWGNFSQKTIKKSSVFLLVLLGVFGSYGFLPQTLSYNSISLMCGCIWLALISGQLTTARLILLGATLTLLFYSKVTVCLILSLLTVVFLIISHRKTAGRKLLLLCSPFLLVELVFTLVLGESGVTRAIATQEMLDYRPDYHLLTIIKYTAVGVFWCGLVVIPFVIAGYLKRKNNFYFKILTGIGVVVFLLISHFTTITGEVNHYLLLGTLAAMGFLLGASSFSCKPDKRQIGFLLLLIGFPFILHFGSNVYFLRLGIHYWVFWILAILFLLRKEHIKERGALYMLCSLFSMALVVNGISLYAFNSYTYKDETALWEYRKDKFIRLPLPEVSLYSDLSNLVFEYDEQVVLPIYRNPGLVYMVGKRHPKTPGLWSSDQLRYFFSNSEAIAVIFYNDTFEFPFDKSEWSEDATYAIKDDQLIKVFWRK